MGVGLLATGTALPDSVREVRDGIFDRARQRAQTIEAASAFYGLDRHRVLGTGESIAELTARASAIALERAALPAARVDRLYGAISVSEYIAPNALYRVHDLLGLPASALTVPIQGEFCNFLIGLVAATEAVRAGGAAHALVAAGVHWTGNLDYDNSPIFGIGDGAGAVLVGSSERFQIVDWASETLGSQYRAMTMRTRPESGLPMPTFGLEPGAGAETFYRLGMTGAPRLVGGLLARNGVGSDRVTLFTHQATRSLMDHWGAHIAPHHYPDTLREYGNMLFASVPVTLDAWFQRISTDYLVLYGIGIGSVAQLAVLIRV